MKVHSLVQATLTLVLISAFAQANAAKNDVQLTDYPEVAASWYHAGEQKVKSKAAALGVKAQGKAKNVILLIGDGMGISTVTAARIFAGQQHGLLGEEYELAFDKFPYSGLSRTYNTNQQTPDSAGTMTAMITGVKTKAGVLSVNDGALRGECDSQKNNELLSAVELAEIAGMATGVVSTARITHATPAATYASSVERDWESDISTPAVAREAGCEDIASQLIHFSNTLTETVAQIRPKSNQKFSSDGIDVVLGGGAKNFLPAGQFTFNGTTLTGKREDGRNLVKEWQENNPKGIFVANRDDLNHAAKSKTQPLFGLFSNSHMAYDSQRSAEKQKKTEPSLAEMTSAALDILQQNKKGYFLMVEAGRIDHAHHINNAYNALQDTVALSDAVDVAVARTDPKDTLIIVTADHSHVFMIAGYAPRGNPILGKSKHTSNGEWARDLNNKPYTTVGYLNGPGFELDAGNHNADARYDTPAHSGRAEIEKIDTQDPGYHQETLVPLDAETHAGEDVAIYARGPGAVLVSGSNEQNVIFHVMNYTADLVGRAQRALK
ncbi:alkaline phosphatase [Alteromonadaceae bacterium 2753L.S.0a.02]|nr:alkaline phosphatase [Alteromonadaceae bacterium 2753L.S.0a.02]